MTSRSPVTTGSIALAELVAYLGEHLAVADFEDYGPNGLQVEGRTTINKIVTGVSACVELFERARDAGADAVIVHHGLFWSGLSPILTGSHYRRVAQLIGSGTSLLAYHLPLDAHQNLGNNALAASGLGLDNPEPFGWAKGSQVGCRGTFHRPLDADTLATRCHELFAQEPLVLGRKQKQITSAAIVTGGAQELLHEAIAVGVDAFVTGEASEWVTNLARETDICYFAAGHHATERLGIQALGEHVARRFGVEVEFIDVPNPV